MRKCLAVGLVLAALVCRAQTSLISYGSQWKYLDNGSNQGTAWKEGGFNDASWPSGAAEFGYGDGDETTPVSYGRNTKKKYITTYFRKTITVVNPAQFGSFLLNLKRDDGAVVYVNGVERFRSNMPTGTISYNTRAASEPADDGKTAQRLTLPAGSLVSGTNVVAVEVHQRAGDGPDLSFDLELLGLATAAAATLTRGPYLQLVSGSAATLRWRTDVATNSRIEVGTQHGSYTQSATNSTITTEHEVRITGLSPDTRYYYRFGSSAQVLQSGTDNYFVTAPPATSTRRIRVAAFGDCGRNSQGNQTGSLTSYLNHTAGNPGELMLLLGDNAYYSGLDSEFQRGFFNAYSATILKNHALFPAPGNHDYADNAQRQADHNIAYYDIFSTPAGGECGGAASGTEAFYSFDWGNIHFLSLDSYGKENGGTTRLSDTLGAQVEWIKRDLAANTRKWTIAYWHHPPYTMGSHNSDTEGELIRIRENFIRILERYGVDMILCGHSHDYERSYLLNNYYGNEASFSAATHTLSTSSGRYNGTTNFPPYITVSNRGNHGTVYVVSGSAGASGGIEANYPHNALPFAMNEGGMFYFEVEDNRLDAFFLRKDGVVADQFTIVKDVNRSSTRTIAAGSSVQLTASWIGNYRWNSGQTTRSITVSPPSTTTYIVRDEAGCLSDTIVVVVIPVVSLLGTARDTMEVVIVPTLVRRGEPLRVKVQPEAGLRLVVSDAEGRVVQQLSTTGNATLDTKELAGGTYFVQWNQGGRMRTRKFVVMY